MRERAAENSKSFAQKDTVCANTSINGGLAGGQAYCLSLPVSELSAPAPRVKFKGPVVKGSAIGAIPYQTMYSAFFKDDSFSGEKKEGLAVVKPRRLMMVMTRMR